MSRKKRYEQDVSELGRRAANHLANEALLLRQKAEASRRELLRQDRQKQPRTDPKKRQRNNRREY